MNVKLHMRSTPETNIQMFQISWVQFLTATVYALARALQLTEM